LILCGITAAALMTSCGQQVNITTGDPSAGDTELSGESPESPETPTQAPENVDIMNFTPPEKGDKIIELKFKDYDGIVKFRLFPEYADLGAENFIGLAEDGFYDGLTFHRIIKDFMIQGGDPLGTGGGGKSLWGSSFDGGTDPHLIHLSGAVAYANSGTTASNTSQFYIVTGEDITDELFEQYSAYGYSFSDKAKEAYKQNGGTPFLDGNYTVFGQVFEGLDIVYQIQCNATDANDKPLDDVIIESVKVTEYNGEELKWNISDYDFDDPKTHEVANFTPPEIDDEIVVMNIKDYGEVKIRVFPELMPQASENFIELARQGYYDGLTFHRVIKDFMIQGGDPNGNGTGGASIWGEKFDGGTYFNLIHAAGAVAYANSGATSTNGSQFYIVTGQVYGKESLEGLTESAKEVYSTVGGTPYLDGNYTVFGQVIDGLDIIFDIQNVVTDTTNDKPVEDVVIESMTVEKYDGSDIHWYISDTDDTTESNTDSEETTEEETAE
ncbi:MAG: peptidylprolyl isomerase, partial [Ruminococcus sp.]|nr:peptidylprolyl isomerase [Ruminococcus sp.]